MTMLNRTPDEATPPPSSSLLPPILPNLGRIIDQAEQALEYWQGKLDQAQEERDNAQAILDRLLGKPKQATPRLPTFSAESYKAILGALGNHDYAGINTVAYEAGCSRSHAGRVLQVATDRGHARQEKRNRKFRYSLTEAGLEALG